MKMEDYESIITKLSNPDTNAEGLLDLNERLKADVEEYDKDQKSITELRDSNQKLYLRATERVQGSPPPEDPEDQRDAYEKLMDKLKKNIGG